MGEDDDECREGGVLDGSWATCDGLFGRVPWIHINISLIFSNINLSADVFIQNLSILWHDCPYRIYDISMVDTAIDL